MSELREPWRCETTGNIVGTDTVFIGAPPCQCRGCRGDRVEKERDEARAHARDERRRADSLLETLDKHQTAADAKEGLIEQAVRALGEQTCPRPCNGRPDNFSVAQCVGAGECGCIDAAALPALTPLLKASRRPQNREETE